jgi:Clostridium epsilon toxin ETX/Bacillus mosquitocidal toxin MTX2
MAHNEFCLRPNESLKCNEWLRSKNGLFHAVIQPDGNFVIYRGDWLKATDNTHLWSTVVNDCNWKPYAVPGSFTIVMQGDGNLVIYADGGGPVWALTTHHNDVMVPGSWAVLHDDGNFAVGPGGEWSKRKYSTDKTDTIDEKSLELNDIEYNLTAAKITRMGGPRESVSQVARNDTDVQQDATLTMSVTKTKSTSWKTSTTLKIGAKTTFKCGVPSLAEGKVEVSAELTQGFEWNETTSESKTETVSLKVIVPPHKRFIGRCTWSDSTISIPYKAVGKAKYNGFANKIPIHIEGVYDGILTHDIETAWSDITDKHPELRFWRGAQKVD